MFNKFIWFKKNVKINMAKEISLDNPKINNLVRQIESGEVKIPPLQRPD